MTNSNYNNMFSISEVKTRFYDAATGLITNHSGPRYTGISKYDLPNSNVYNLEDELLEVADQVTYNTEYLLYLFHAHILEVRNFLDHHFGRTPDKTAFLDYNEYGIVTDPGLSDGKKKLIGAWIKEQRQKKYEDQIIVGEWQSYIDPLVINSFLDTEKRATNNTLTFPSAIRCAAFCEMIYHGQKKLGKPYLIQTKTPSKTMAAFAFSRYQIKIMTSLGGGEKKDNRRKHQTQKTNSLPPLKNFF